MTILQGILGILIFPGLAWLLSENRRAFSWRLVAGGLVIQFGLGILLLKLPVLSDILRGFNQVVMALDTATREGTAFVFGYLGGGPTPFEVIRPENSFIVAFQVLPLIIVVSALSSLLFHWGILQKIIAGFAFVLRRNFKIDGASAMGVAASVFLGIIEAPILLKAWLGGMSRSGLFLLLTAGMATVAGTVMVLYASILAPFVDNAAGQIIIASVMSAPAAILMARLMIPETDFPANGSPAETAGTKGEAAPQLTPRTSSAFEAIMNGIGEGVPMVIHIAAVLVVLFAFVSLINMGLGWMEIGDAPLTIQRLAGYLFAPLVWLMGVESSEVLAAGQLMGIKLILNEFVAYSQLGESLSVARHRIIMTYALCGFANFGSLGILVGGLGELLPERKRELVGLTLKALVAGTLATMLTGTIIGLMI